MALAIVATLHVALFLYYLQASIIVQPFWDMFWHVLRYLDYREAGGWWAYLWDSHVQHRHVWMRLLTAFDVEMFSGAAYPFIVSAAACQGAAAWLLWRESRHIEPPELRTAAGCLVVMLVLTSVSAVVCAIPMDAIYPQMLLFSVLALVLFDAPGPGGPEAEGVAPWRRVAAMLAAVGAAFANTVALALWPVLAWSAWRQGARAWTIGVTITGAAFIALYLQGMPLTPEGAPTTAAGLDRAIERGDYLLAYMGLPWTRAAALATPGRIVGAVLLLASLWAVIGRGLARSRGGRLERLGVGLVLLSLASAAMATAGRVDVQGEVTVPVRYSLFLIPLHVGLLFLAVPYVRRQWEVEARRPVIRAAMLAAGGLLIVQQIAAGETAAAVTQSMRATIQRFVAGEEDPGMTQVVFINLDEARAASRRIREAGLYLEAR